MIWLILRKTAIRWDEACGFVVVAPSEVEARDVAAEHCGDEGEDYWFSSANASCKAIGTYSGRNTPALILRDYNAG